MSTTEDVTEPRWTAERIRALGVRTNVETAGSIFGMSRMTAYRLAKEGGFPVPVIKIGSRYRVPVQPILRLLGIEAA